MRGGRRVSENKFNGYSQILPIDLRSNSRLCKSPNTCFNSLCVDVGPIYIILTIRSIGDLHCAFFFILHAQVYQEF